MSSAAIRLSNRCTSTLPLGWHESRARAGSGVGADAHAHSPYIRSRGEGEDAVRAAFPAASIVRPCVMFGPDDAFFAPLAALVRRLPIIPLFGRGQTLLQPSYVEDVAEAVARIVQAPQPAAVYELGGLDTLSYEAVL